MLHHNSKRHSRRRVARPGILAAAACAIMVAAVPAGASAATQSTQQLTIAPVDPAPVFNAWPTSGGTQPISVTGGPDGNVWYTEVSSPAGDDLGVGRLTSPDRTTGLRARS